MRFLSFVFCVVVFFSCSKAPERPISNQVVVIFKKDSLFEPKQIDDFFLLKNVKMLFAFDGYCDTMVQLNNVQSDDTVLFYTRSGNLNLCLKYFELDSRFEYQLIAGDTIEVSYAKDFPLVKIMNRPFSYNDVNCAALMSQRLGFYQPFSYMFQRVNNDCNSIDFIEREIVPSIKAHYDKESKLLDSMFRAREIGIGCYQMNRQRLLYNLKSIARVKKFEPFLQDFEPLKGVTFNENDTLLKYNYFREYLGGWIWDSLLVDRRTIASGQKVKDFPFGFDTMVSHKRFGQKIHDYLLLYTLKQIDVCSPLVLDAYYAKFIKVVKDTALIRIANYRYGHSTDVAMANEDDLLLKTQNGNKRSFDSLVLASKGNVLYIDFWASWCAPCRASMPASEKLRDCYKGKNVSFAYISLDKNESEWRTALKVVFPYNFPLSFHAMNPKASNFIKEIKLSSIPRYLLFNKQGKLVSKNAPGPEGDAIHLELNRLLKE